MKSEELIPTSWFWKEEDDKIKLHWLLYEFACGFFEHLDRNSTKRIIDWKAKRTDEQIAEFCAYYAKRMKPSIVELLETDSESFLGYTEYLTDYLHDNTLRENESISKVSASAWDNLLEVCIVCPVRCLDEPAEHCDLFDRMKNGRYTL
jgi:hypothetical protein